MYTAESNYRKVEIDQRVVFVLATGLYKPRETNQLLLSGPAENQNNKIIVGHQRSDLQFDPEIEPQYLNRLPEWLRRGQLEMDISTALQEIYLSQYGNNFVLDSKGQLRDTKTNESLLEINQRGGCEEEIHAIEKIQMALASGQEIVIHISPENLDKKYPDNMVDLWLRSGKGVVRWMRYKCDGDLDTFLRFYKRVGGKENVESNNDLLRNPVTDSKLALGDILSMLAITKDEGKIGNRDIQRLTEEMLDRFYDKYGTRVEKDRDMVLRVYCAVKEECKNLIAKGIKDTKEREKRVNRAIQTIPIDVYTNGRMEVKRVKGAGCGSEGLEGRFENDKFGSSMGWVLEVKDGRLVSHWGSTEGLTFCEQCKCWHRGERCPFCDDGVPASC